MYTNLTQERPNIVLEIMQLLDFYVFTREIIVSIECVQWDVQISHIITIH